LTHLARTVSRSAMYVLKRINRTLMTIDTRKSLKPSKIPVITKAFKAIFRHELPFSKPYLLLLQTSHKMEYLNKLNKFRSTLSTTVESTVFSTVSTITNALPGNPVTRDFEVFEHVASGGPGIRNMTKLSVNFRWANLQSDKRPAI